MAKRRGKTYMGLLCGKLRKAHTKVQRRGKIVVRGGMRANSGRGNHEIKIAYLVQRGSLGNVVRVRDTYLE